MKNYTFKTLIVFILLIFVDFTNILAQKQFRGASPESKNNTFKGNIHALIIGISSYKNISNLDYAHKDAQAFHDYLISPAGGSVPKANISLLINNDATVSKIMLEIGNLVDPARVKSDDRVIIYFSGHGDQETIAQRPYFLTYETESKNYVVNALDMTVVKKYLEKISTEINAQVWLFVDACRSGELANSQDSGVQLARAYLMQMRNQIIVTACQANEVSFEGPTWGNGAGVFTYHLIRGLQGLADTQSEDGKVTLLELQNYLQDRVNNDVVIKTIGQFPIVSGKLQTVLSIVHPLTKKALLEKKPIPSFSPLKGKGYENKILNNVGKEVQGIYKDYEKAIAKIQPDSAIAYYENLITNSALEDLHPFIQRQLVFILMNKSQNVLTNYLEKRNSKISRLLCSNIIRHLEYAEQVLVGDHPFYKYLKSRTQYFKGVYENLYGGNTQKAIDYFNLGISYDNTATYIYNELGALYYKEKMYELAQRTFENGLSYGHKWDKIYNNLGNTFVRKNELLKALDCYEKAITLDGNNSRSFYNICCVYSRQNNPEKALSYLEKALQLGYNNFALIDRDNDLNNIRNLVQYKSLIERFRK